MIISSFKLFVVGFSTLSRFLQLFTFYIATQTKYILVKPLRFHFGNALCISNVYSKTAFKVSAELQLQQSLTKAAVN